MTPQDLMRRAVALALESARTGGGPFGALVARPDGRVVAEGANRVIAAKDSTAHAEIVALRAAQQALGTHRLDGMVLYTSCAPCIQCYGAIYWSGVTHVFACATKEDAESLGFEEGPPMDDLWEHAQKAKGIEYVPRFGRDEAALAPFKEYARRGGENYSRS